MEYTIGLLKSFLTAVENYSQQYSMIENKYNHEIEGLINGCSKRIAERIDSEKKLIERFLVDKEKTLSNYTVKVSEIEKGEKSRRSTLHDQLIERIGSLYEMDERIKRMTCYTKYNGAASSIQNLKMNITSFSMDTVRGMIKNVESNEKSKDFGSFASELAQYHKGAGNYLIDEIAHLFLELFANSKEVGEKRNQSHRACTDKINEINKITKDELLELFQKAVKFRNDEEDKLHSQIKIIEEKKELELKKLTESFFKAYPTQSFKEEFMRIYRLEPDISNYTCTSEIPLTLKIGNIVYPLSDLNLSSQAKNMLINNYYFLINYPTGNVTIKFLTDFLEKASIKMPYSIRFDNEFNYCFDMNNSNRSYLVNRVCSIAMRLFMMLPPGKVRFTFLDPGGLGDTFALFGRLVEQDDRTNKVINGKIWTSERDIQERLQIITDHIANITQRCLQGKYESIRQYNEAAAQNAESYEILMIMDFPQNFNEQSLKLLEQILSSGPKCGVFTIILKDHEQYETADYRRIKPLAAKILNSVTQLTYDNAILFNKDSYRSRIELDIPSLYSADELNKIIPILKEGIKKADRVVIPYDSMLKYANITHSTAECIRIPIGIHGANEVQYLTLGTGGSHHALIAGITGSGKSTLIHNIIFGLLSQYDPDELSIYLVDFKRGVEFKIYAEYELPVFKVIAIESEREFGYNVLAALEREQKIRADRFRRSNTYQLSEYREQHKKVPRILVIIDEFQELFSDGSDELGKKSADILERIVRQGRAFGVHLMLATQSYSNIKGIDSSVFKQMAVRIVLKCSDTDANLMLDDGASIVDQISLDDPGRAVYNSEAGNKAFNSHFRVAYIPPSDHKKILQKISERTKQYVDPNHPTRILLSNIEDNHFSFFKQFPHYTADTYQTPGRLYIGESLDLDNNTSMIINRTEYSNVLMVGNDTDMARSMFTFSLLSVCINYWIMHKKAPEKPIISLLNAKPLYDSYFKDTVKLIADYLPNYIRYIPNDDTKTIRKTVSDYFTMMTSEEKTTDGQYFFVFGYQKTEDLKSEEKMSQTNEIDDIFNIMQINSMQTRYSVKEMMSELIKNGAQNGIHTVIWQDSFDALYQEDRGLISYFALRIAFEMTEENYSRFIGYNDKQQVGTNNAIFYSKARDNQKFRPYQSPNEDWLKEICSKIK